MEPNRAYSTHPKAPELSDYSDEALALELTKRKTVRRYDVGLWAPYDVVIRQRYYADREPVDLPNSAVVLVIERF